MIISYKRRITKFFIFIAIALTSSYLAAEITKDNARTAARVLFTKPLPLEEVTGIITATNAEVAILETQLSVKNNSIYEFFSIPIEPHSYTLNNSYLANEYDTHRRVMVEAMLDSR